MANVITLGLRVEGSAAQREIRVTREELVALANGGKEAAKVMKEIIPPEIVPPAAPPAIHRVTAAIDRMRVAAAAAAKEGQSFSRQLDVARLQVHAEGVNRISESIRRMQEAARRADDLKLAEKIEAAGRTAATAAPNIDKLRGPLTAIAISASGIPGPLGRVASLLGSFAVGGMATAGALAGIGAIALAWKELRQHSEEQRAENLRVVESFKSMERELSASAKNIRIATLEAQEAALTDRVGQGVRGFGRGDSFWERWSGVGANRAYEAATAQLAEVRNRLADLRREQAAFIREGNGVLMLPGVTTTASRITPATAGKEYTAPAGTNNPDPMAFFRKLQQDRIEAARKVAEAEEESAKRAADAWDRMRQQQMDEVMRVIYQIHDAMASVAGTALGGVDQIAGTRTGMFSGLGMGLATGNPYMAGASVVNEVLSGVFEAFLGGDDSAARFAEELRAIQSETDRVNDSLAVMAGRMSRAQAQIRGLNAEYDAQQAEMEALIAVTSENAFAGNIAEKAAQKLAVLNAAQRARVELIEEEVRQYNIASAEDLRVRLLRLQGLNDEADRYELLVRHSREYTEALANSADAANLATLAEVHRLEAIDMAMGQAQRRIDSLSGTISGLSDFRNSLLLSETQSPTARLAEARRQYDEILAVASGEDLKRAQDASGRLPGIAQILLDASRGVHASGAGFQSDFAGVLSDSAALIQRFSDMKSVEELMLEELKAIRDNTYPLKSDVWTPPGGIGHIPAEETADNTGATVTVLQEGFTQLLAEVRDLRDEMAATRRTIQDQREVFAQ